MQHYVASMGVVLDAAKIYPAEGLILAGVWLICVLPTMICIGHMAKKDGLGN